MRSKKNRIFSCLLHKMIFQPEKCAFRYIIFVIVFSLLIRTTYTVENNENNIEMVHEKNGQPRFLVPEYTPYESKPIYTKIPDWTYMGMSPTHSFTNFLFKHLYGFDKNQPTGYISENQNNLTFLGPKVIRNDWRDLLASNKAVILWIMLLLFLIVVIPFIATCYFCFCLCLCPFVCPPCDRRSLHKKRLIFSTLLGLLMLGILLGLIIAFLNDKLVDRGFRENSNILRRGGADTCAFLKDVSDHVYHLFVLNFEELQTQITAKLEDAHNHIFLDLTDSSGASALLELEVIIHNIKNAVELLHKLRSEHEMMKFFTSQYRDSLRGTKRDVLYILTVWCDWDECQRMLRRQGFLDLDTSKCLHLDYLPDTNKFVEAIEDIVNKELDDIPSKGIKNIQKISELIQKTVEPEIPILVGRLAKINFELRNEANEISKITKAYMSKIYINTLRSANNFDAFFFRHGTDRKIVSNVVCFLIFLALVLLAFALILGCCVRKNNAGSHCILLAMLIIFFVFSFIMLVSLFYFMLGWVMYAGACVERTDQEKSELYHQLSHGFQNRDKEPEETYIKREFQACGADETIIDFLRSRSIYDINKLTNMTSLKFKTDDIVLHANINNIEILSEADLIALDSMRSGNLSSYHSRLYTEHLCKNLSVRNIAQRLQVVYQKIVDLYNSPNDPNYNGQWKTKYWFALMNIYRLKRDVNNYDDYNPKVTTKIGNIEELVIRIDKLITRNDLNFGDTIGEMLDRIKKSEHFLRELGQDFINEMLKNLTNSVHGDIENFIQNLIAKSKADVGPCKFLAHIYFREIDWTCKHVVNPINGFWLGLMICGLLFLPLLFVAHRLLCLFKIIAGPRIAVLLPIGGNQCPTCTGAPYIPPPILVCSDGQQATCSCQAAVNQAKETLQTSNLEPGIRKSKRD